MLEAQDLQAIAQMIATATAEAVKPLYSAMSEKQAAEMAAATKAERMKRMMSGEVQPETPEEEEALALERIKGIRPSLLRRGHIAPANDEERKIWRDAHGYDYKDVSQLRR